GFGQECPRRAGSGHVLTTRVVRAILVAQAHIDPRRDCLYQGTRRLVVGSGRAPCHTLDIPSWPGACLERPASVTVLLITIIRNGHHLIRERDPCGTARWCWWLARSRPAHSRGSGLSG